MGTHPIPIILCRYGATLFPVMQNTFYFTYLECINDIGVEINRTKRDKLAIYEMNNTFVFGFLFFYSR